MSFEVTPLVVALVGCGKSKAPAQSAVKARDLYKSTLFCLSMKYADLYADDTHILSAKHGLLAPHEMIRPYDVELGKEAVVWAHDVVDSLLECYHDTALELVFLSGRRYSDAIARSIQVRGIAWAWNAPLRPMGLYQRLRWLKENCDAISE